MGRSSPARMLQIVGAFAWLLVGAMARPAAAQEPAPAAAAPSYADVIPSVETVQPPVQPINPSAWSGRTEYPLGEVILESICGKPDPDTWRPLYCSTLFSEGWLEPWVPSPNGSGGAPRQGWINAADGNFYRLWWFTFAQGFNQGPKSNAYLGAYTLYTPLSRRPFPRSTDQHEADPRHADPLGPRLVFPGRSTHAVDQCATRRPRHDLLVHEGVVI